LYRPNPAPPRPAARSCHHGPHHDRAICSHRPRDDTISDFAPLTESQIANQTDSGSFSRGRGYFRSGRIFDAVRRESTLRARCHGSSGGPYLVEVTLAPSNQAKGPNPIAFACDCPRGGFCKHIVALLLTWIDAPESFEVRPPIAEVLSEKCQEELIALIEQMLRAVPELEEMLGAPLPVAGAPGNGLVDEATIRRQVANAIREGEDFDGYDRYGRRGRYDYDDYYQARRIARKLEQLIALAVAHADAGQPRNALRIAAALVEELVPQLPSIYDHDGDLFVVLGHADEVLAACLDAQEGAPDDQRLTDDERSRLIDVILAIWQKDLEIGALDLAGPEAIARAASAEEQRRVGDWLRRSIKTESDNEWHRSWHNRQVIGFLSLLGGGAGLYDEELLTEYRNAELWDDAAALLLRMDRVDEAIAIATRRLTAAASLTAFTDRLIATGEPRRIEQAITLIDDRLWEAEGQNARNDQALGEWLQRRYAEHGRPEKALALAHDRFRVAPDRRTYDAVKTAALLPGQPGDPWPALRPELIATLQKRGGWYGLIDIHLEEGEVAEAIAALKQAEKPSKRGKPGYDYGFGYGWAAASGEYDKRVAAAAEAEFPDESIRLYRRQADRMIDHRQRPYYQEAAKYLARVKALLEANGRTEEWTALIADLRDQHKRLRALREELDALGLG
jgi:uncharacterized Zn finger protein